ncbi:MAG TPA: sugar ABC transporter substrate-binding protein [Desulfarculaceae bacterium]|nr:sugar ABC transporter substrate-binding protein [Desulfarculaceae bacterium]
MSMLNETCKDFNTVLASKAPVPGGGGAAAMGGAIGMALSNMVGNLTIGKKKYADVEDEAKELVAKGEKVIAALEAQVDKDAEVFEPLSKAYGMPRETDEEKKLKAETMEACGKTACSVPLDIMRQAYAGIKIHQRMGEIGTMIAISDVACGVAFMKAALISGSLNVIININGIKDEEFNKAAKTEMDQLLADGSKIADETLELVLGKLQK